MHGSVLKICGTVLLVGAGLVAVVTELSSGRPRDCRIIAITAATLAGIAGLWL